MAEIKIPSEADLFLRMMTPTIEKMGIERASAAFKQLDPVLNLFKTQFLEEPKKRAVSL